MVSSEEESIDRAHSGCDEGCAFDVPPFEFNLWALSTVQWLLGVPAAIQSIEEGVVLNIVVRASTVKIVACEASEWNVVLEIK